MKKFLSMFKPAGDSVSIMITQLGASSFAYDLQRQTFNYKSGHLIRLMRFVAEPKRELHQHSTLIVGWSLECRRTLNPALQPFVTKLDIETTSTLIAELISMRFQSWMEDEC